MKNFLAQTAWGRHQTIHGGYYSLFLIWLLLSPAILLAAPEIIIDTGKARLTVVDNGKPLLQLEQIAIGRFGATPEKQKGDGMTPTGRYQIGWMKQNSQFQHFIGLNYPAPVDAQRGLSQGIIDQQTYDRIMTAHREHQVPPQDTKLGGFLGIHGLGEADISVHKRYNWTRGCIATTNDQLDQLLSWIKKGMWVEIR